MAAWVPGWEITDSLPEGAVELWVLVFTGDGEPMGGARAPERPRWLWRDGHLCLDYSPVRVTVRNGGFYSTGLICAVSQRTGQYRPLLPVSLGKPAELRPGDNITITDGVIMIHPDLPGPHG